MRTMEEEIGVRHPQVSMSKRRWRRWRGAAAGAVVEEVVVAVEAVVTGVVLSREF